LNPEPQGSVLQITQAKGALYSPTWGFMPRILAWHASELGDERARGELSQLTANSLTTHSFLLAKKVTGFNYRPIKYDRKAYCLKDFLKKYVK